jgi:hypothetical protein
VKRRASVDCVASMARLALTSTIMMRCLCFARTRASRTLIDSPRTSPILRRAGIYRLSCERSVAVDRTRGSVDLELLRVAWHGTDATHRR